MNAPIDPPRPPVHHSSPTTGPHTPKASQPPFRTCLESRATTTPSYITLQLLVGTNFLRFLKLHWTVLYCALDLTMKPHTTFLFLCKLVDRSKPEYSKQISHVSADQTNFTFDCSNPHMHPLLRNCPLALAFCSALSILLGGEHTEYWEGHWVFSRGDDYCWRTLTVVPQRSPTPQLIQKPIQPKPPPPRHCHWSHDRT